MLSFDSAGAIDVSTFSGIYRGNPVDSTYERRNLLDARQIGGRVNSELFAQENALSSDGQVCARLQPAVPPSTRIECDRMQSACIVSCIA